MPWILRVVLIQLLALPAAVLVGKAVLVPVTTWSALGLVVLVLKGAFFFAGVHVLIVWPLHHFAESEMERIKNHGLRQLLAFFLMGAPLAAFMILYARIKGYSDYCEIAVSLLPSLFLGSLLSL